ncbi:MAG: NAD(P)-dependent oxidoreductase [Myxococcota bacterium]
MKTLKNHTIFITGASRGIGREIALRCARDGANIVIAAKSAEPHAKLPGTIFSVAKEVEEAGGKALPLQLDVRDTDQIAQVVQKAAIHFGGIDVLVNNAGAIRLTSTDATPAKSFDLMMGVNARATFFCSQACLPYLEKSQNAHILNLSPPITFEPKWLQNNLAYTMTKYGMSLCTVGMAAEFRDKRISVNSLWPRTAIWTAAIDMLMGEDAMNKSRKPAIVSDAAHALFLTPGGEITGQWLIDDDFLKSQGITDFDQYACVPGTTDLIPDFFV